MRYGALLLLSVVVGGALTVASSWEWLHTPMTRLPDGRLVVVQG